MPITAMASPRGEFADYVHEHLDSQQTEMTFQMMEEEDKSEQYFST